MILLNHYYLPLLYRAPWSKIEHDIVTCYTGHAPVSRENMLTSDFTVGVRALKTRARGFHGKFRRASLNVNIEYERFDIIYEISLKSLGSFEMYFGVIKEL